MAICPNISIYISNTIFEMQNQTEFPFISVTKLGTQRCTGY